MPSKKETKSIISLVGIVLVIAGLAFAGLSLPSYSVVGAGGCSFGGVYSLQLSPSSAVTNQTVTGTGQISGTCSAQGDKLYFWTGDGTISSSTSVTGSNSYSFTFIWPNTYSYLGRTCNIFFPCTLVTETIYASLCPKSGCTVSQLSGTAYADLTLSNAPQKTTSVIADFSDSSAAVNGQLYSGTNLIQVQSGTGQLIFTNIVEGAYELYYEPLSGINLNGQVMINVPTCAVNCGNVIVNVTYQHVESTFTTTYTTTTNGQVYTTTKATSTAVSVSTSTTTFVSTLSTVTTQSSTLTGSNGKATTTTVTSTTTSTTTTTPGGPPPKPPRILFGSFINVGLGVTISLVGFAALFAGMRKK